MDEVSSVRGERWAEVLTKVTETSGIDTRVLLDTQLKVYVENASSASRQEPKSKR